MIELSLRKVQQKHDHVFKKADVCDGAKVQSLFLSDLKLL